MVWQAAGGRCRRGHTRVCSHPGQPGRKTHGSMVAGEVQLDARTGKLTKSRKETGRVRNGRISGREEFTGKSKWGAIHKLGGAGTEVRLQRAADSKQDQGEVLRPVGRISLGTQGRLQLTMKPLDHTVSCGVVGSGAKAANTETR